MRLLRAIVAVGLAGATAITLPLSQASAAPSPSVVAPDFAVTPSSGPIGTYLTVTLLKPCPTPAPGDAGDAAFILLFPASAGAGFQQFLLIPDGDTFANDLPTYSGDFNSHDLGVGPHKVLGECDEYSLANPDDEFTVKTLAPVTFTVTEPRLYIGVLNSIIEPEGTVSFYEADGGCPLAAVGGVIQYVINDANGNEVAHSDSAGSIDGSGDWSFFSYTAPPDATPGLYYIQTYCKAPTGVGDFEYETTDFRVGPVVAGVIPNSGPLAGGTVEIWGYGFTGALHVMFGSTQATNVDVVSDNEITATAPHHSAGVVNVHVVGPNFGTSPTIIGDQFTYQAVPVVSGVSPTQGVSSGGTTVTLNGSGFTGATQVLFGSTAGTNLTVVSDSQVTVTSPRHSVGPINVHIVTPGGKSAVVSADLFSYQALPAVTGVSPLVGPAAGGTTVTVTGTGFTGATQVLFGSTPGTNVVVVSSTQVTVTSPHHSATAVSVHVVTPIGKSPVSSGTQFTYQ